MDIIRDLEAVLFYRDGQVKFTKMVVRSTQHYYRETFVPDLCLDDCPSEKAAVHIHVYHRDFIQRGDIFGYRIYEEMKNGVTRI